ncbi:hypothetical protein DL770_004445 [Monosporascus sp. CRB-9-2]|nr:hypothetical protein DL770_004445 [Monosporascus sp. CRB-9-2]
MADSVDRVFVQALQTVKKIPKTGAPRPPPQDRLRLYGLYKQAMEGDVDGVMERPTAGPGIDANELQREKDKWDAWNAQSGLSRTEAKRRYIEALIETMHRFATTPGAMARTAQLTTGLRDSQELVSELEFVWNQIKNNSPSMSEPSPKAHQQQFQQPPMKVLSPTSEDDAAEQEFREQQDGGDDEDDGDGDGEYVKKGDKWSRKVERALVRLSAEIAALREQITTGREWRSKKERSISTRVGWVFRLVAKHLAIDLVILCVMLLWMRWRKDRRLEDQHTIIATPSTTEPGFYLFGVSSGVALMGYSRAPFVEHLCNTPAKSTIAATCHYWEVMTPHCCRYEAIQSPDQNHRIAGEWRVGEGFRIACAEQQIYATQSGQWASVPADGN